MKLNKKAVSLIMVAAMVMGSFSFAADLEDYSYGEGELVVKRSSSVKFDRNKKYRDTSTEPPAVEEPVAPEPEPVPPAVEEPVAPEPEPVPPAVEEPVAPEPEPVPPAVEEPVAPEPEPVPPAVEEPVAPEPEPVPPAVEEPVAPEPEPVPPVLEDQPIDATQKPVTIPEIKLYSQDSPFNQKIAADARVDRNSDLMINSLIDSYNMGDMLVAKDSWTVAAYFADENTPRYDVKITASWAPATVIRDVPIPDFAVPDPGEGHMAIIDQSTGYEYDFWLAEKVNGQWTAGWANKIAYEGDGIYPEGLSCRGSGLALLGGVIWPEELRSGRIDHALVFSYAFPKAGEPVYPATESDGNSYRIDAIPEGARLQLDPDLNLDALGLTSYEKTIARAMQEYGMILCDNGSSGIELEAVNPISASGNSYEGLMPNDPYVYLQKIPVESFRVLDLPTDGYVPPAVEEPVAPEPEPVPPVLEDQPIDATQKPVTIPEIKLYSQDSPFNQKIAADARVDRNSDLMINSLIDSYNMGDMLVAKDSWTVAAYFADENTPRYDVKITASWAPATVIRDVPIPDFAVPDPGEGHMAIIDQSTGYEYDFWLAEKVNGQWTAGWANKIAYEGDGIYPEGLSCRGSGLALLGGVIWPEELRSGRIDHALVFSYAFPKAGEPVYPATESDGNSYRIDAIPEGARLQLDPDLNLDALGLTSYEKTIARAMQEYGMILCDNGSSGIELEAVNPISASGNSYEGLMPNDPYVYLQKIPVESFRVLELPQ